MARDPNDVLLGGGRVFLNNVEVGWLSGEIGLNEAKNSLAIKESEGATVVNINLDKEVHFTFGLLGPDLDTLAMFDPSFTKIIYGAGVATATDEYIENLGGSNDSLKHQPISELTPVVVVPATVLKNAAQTGATDIYVQNARKFAAGDTLAIVAGATIEINTVSAVVQLENKITLGTPMVNSFPSGTMVKNTVSSKALKEGDDYILYPKRALITRPTTSLSTLDGDGAAITYNYQNYQGSGFGSGSFTEAATYRLEFWTMKRGGGCRCIRMFKASISGDYTTFLINQDAESPIPIDVALVADESIADSKRNIYEQIDYEDKSAAPGGGW